MVSPHVSDVSDKANISESDRDDSIENEQQVEKEGEENQLIAKKILLRFGNTSVLSQVKMEVPVIAIHLGVGCVTKGFSKVG